jgi:hypothetical protein
VYLGRFSEFSLGFGDIRDIGRQSYGLTAAMFWAADGDARPEIQLATQPNSATLCEVSLYRRCFGGVGQDEN